MPFRDVIGHRRLVELLSRSIDRGTLPPSLILAGPAGIGKRLASLALSQALNCVSAIRPSTHSGRPEHLEGHSPSAIPFDACGVCAACTRIARGVHPDVLVIEPGDSGSIKIDVVRDAIDRAGYRPFEGKRRVLVIDDADAMAAPPQNALLKTLEEPTPSSVIVLITSRPDLLLPTVRSRCPLLRFRPLTAAEIAQALAARGLSDAEARAVAATADGSIGRALEASAGELVEAREIAHQVLAQSATAAPADGRRIDSAKNLLANTGKGGASDRDQLARYLHAMASLLRDAALVSTNADASTLANSDVAPAIERLASSYRGDRGVRAYAAVDKALEALDRNAGVKIVADWLVLQL